MQQMNEPLCTWAFRRSWNYHEVDRSRNEDILSRQISNARGGGIMVALNPNLVLVSLTTFPVLFHEGGYSRLSDSILT